MPETSDGFLELAPILPTLMDLPEGGSNERTAFVIDRADVSRTPIDPSKPWEGGSKVPVLLTFDVVAEAVENLLKGASVTTTTVLPPDPKLIDKNGLVPPPSKKILYTGAKQSRRVDAVSATNETFTPQGRETSIYVPKQRIGINVMDRSISLNAFRFNCPGSPFGNDRLDVFHTTLKGASVLCFNGPAWTNVTQKEFAHLVGIALPIR